MSLGPYEDAPHLFKYAVLYHGVARASGGTIGPDTVDRWESWQAGAYLGVGLPVPDDAQPGASGRNLVAENAAWHEARIEAEKAGVPPPPPPAPDAPSPGASEALLATFQTRT